MYLHQCGSKRQDISVKQFAAPQLDVENSPQGHSALTRSNHCQLTSFITMTEPPAKRAKRTDSSTMWERHSPRPTDGSLQARATNSTSSIREKREDRERHHGRDDRRHRSRSKERRRDRSRSRDRPEKPRRERSYSRERGSRRHKDSERDGIRDRRDRDRSRSREKHRSRRG